MTAQEVLDFWFSQPPANWFRKNAAFDAEVRERFGATIDAALCGGLREWDEQGAAGTLARILVLDQFTRNAWRATPASFAGDALALAAAVLLVDSGADLALTPDQRAFAYMPFEHAEDPAMQAKAIALFTRLTAQHERFADSLDFAHRHSKVIARFGRFPHRNAILGRASTPEEAAFLTEPGSGF
ncbi:DUF924 family protein [Massilia sp. S19_KUP03_FR1]|uniref:DUF924 family protein n=1 Tax=Massilia sp. S19_KUP03_FR1 TaxID=3025503 RepID=UPI002FCD9551